jgi:hypothetical protein
VFEREKTVYDLDSAATVIGRFDVYAMKPLPGNKTITNAVEGHCM